MLEKMSGINKMNAPKLFYGFISPYQGIYELTVLLVANNVTQTIKEEYPTLEKAEQRATDIKAKYPSNLKNGLDIWTYKNSIRELLEKPPEVNYNVS